MENEIVKSTKQAPQLMSGTTWSAMRDMAGVLLKSGFLPVAIKTSEQCLSIMMTGHELGIGPMASLQMINVIQGKPTIAPQLMLAMANRTGDVEDIAINAQVDGCTVTIKRKGRSPHTESFGVAEATALNLINKDNYKKQPAIMFKWRCLAACLRVVFPDVVLGVYSPEEMGAEVKVDATGNQELATPPIYALKAEAYIAKATGSSKTDSSPEGDWPDDAPRGVIDDVSVKSGTSSKGGKWTKYGIKIGGVWYGTFDAKIGMRASEFKGRDVEFIAHDDGKYKTLDNIRINDRLPVYDGDDNMNETDFPPTEEREPGQEG